MALILGVLRSIIGPLAPKIFSNSKGNSDIFDTKIQKDFASNLKLSGESQDSGKKWFITTPHNLDYHQKTNSQISNPLQYT